MEVCNSDKLTQVCNSFSDKGPQERKDEVNRVAVVYSTGIREELTLVSIWD